MTDKKKKNNSSEEFVNSIVNELTSADLPDSLDQSVDESTAILQDESENQFDPILFETSSDSEKTVVVGSSRVHGHDKKALEEKISFGVAKPSTKSLGSHNASATDAQLMQAENLRIAQQRLNELEQELEKLRAENEHLFSANNVAREKVKELTQKTEQLEKEKAERNENFNSEIEILKDNFSGKEEQLARYREKVDELEGRLRQDIRKIRVRERELENRLEIIKMEKDALLKAKDDVILDLRRKLDQAQHEMDQYKHRVTELNNKIENNHDQLSRTVRALRLALTNLEVNEDGVSLTVAPYKKAE